jgi:hypothetical protein
MCANKANRQVSNVYELLNKNALASKKHVVVDGVKCVGKNRIVYDYLDHHTCSKCRFPSSCIYFPKGDYYAGKVKANRLTTRAVREFHQVKIAQEKFKAFRKAFPKRDRSRDVMRAREEKYWAYLDS